MIQNRYISAERFLASPGRFLCFLFIAALWITWCLALARPDIYVYDDEVVFQALAHDFHQSGVIQKALPYRTTYPPLYPLLLSPGYVLPSRLAVYALQQLLSQATLFSTIFPLYLFSRQVLPGRRALLPPLLFCFMPLTLYSRWLMSESLYLPLFVWGIWLVIALGNRPVKLWHGLALGAIVCAAFLTRMQGALLGIILAIRIARDGWLDLRCGNREQFVRRVVYQGALPVALIALVSYLAWNHWGYLGYKEQDTLLYWKPSPADVLTAGHLLRLPVWLWRNGVVFLAATGLIPAALFLTSALRPSRGTEKAGRAASVVWLALLAHLGLIAYLSWWKEGVQPEQAKTYARYAVCVVPLLLPFVICQSENLWAKHDCRKIKSYGMPAFVFLLCLLPALDTQALQDTLWWFGSNLQPAALAWLAHQADWGLLGLSLFGGGTALLFLAALKWREWAAWLVLLAWLFALQVSGHQFLNWVSEERAVEHQTKDLRQFAISYDDRAETSSIVIEPSGSELDYKAAAVSYWAAADPIIEGRDALPETFLRIGEPKPGDMLFWESGDLRVWLKEKSPAYPGRQAGQ